MTYRKFQRWLVTTKKYWDIEYHLCNVDVDTESLIEWLISFDERGYEILEVKKNGKLPLSHLVYVVFKRLYMRRYR